MCVGWDMEKKQTKLKARRMWANYYPKDVGTQVLHNSARAAIEGSIGTRNPIPVAVIPLDDVDGIIEKAFFAFGNSESACRYDSRLAIRAALTAIGVLPRARKGRK